MQNLSPVALLVFEIYVTKFPSEEGNESSNSAIYPRKIGLALKKLVFYVQNRSSRPIVDPHVNFSNFQAEENFSFCKFLGPLDEKRAAAAPQIDQFC